MSSGATITTPRLKLSPVTVTQASVIAPLAGDRQIADTTISIPHPLDQTGCEHWLMDLVNDSSANAFVITTKETAQVVGMVSLLDLDPIHQQSEISFWVGAPYWGLGYVTEAAQAALHLAFTSFELNRIYAHHMVRNHASAVVLEKLGFIKEGVLRQRVRKWGVFEDVVVLSILKDEIRISSGT